MGRRRAAPADEFPLWKQRQAEWGAAGWLEGVERGGVSGDSVFRTDPADNRGQGDGGSVPGLRAILHKVPRQYGSQGAAGCQGRKLQRG